MRTTLAIIASIHGLIHLAGWAKAYGFEAGKFITATVSKEMGIAWLAATLLFILSSFGLATKREWWLGAMILATVLSQILVISAWKDAMWGTAANLLIVAMAIMIFARANEGAG
jgi:hypothetical protein